MNVLAFISFVCCSAVFGLPYYRDRIPNGHHVPNPCDGGATIWEAVGHYNPHYYTVDKNPFAQKDSDGDGATNGVELGDPTCIHWDHNNFCSCSDHQCLDRFISDRKQSLIKAATHFSGDQTIREAPLGKLCSKWWQYGLVK
ncbi:TEMPT-like protein [Mya arenaria]|uniref:TEMPT-like protein n=1 Tax=Mya arenaria TaxID=6604 RepID=A0ABY7E4M8_MYAAR|nr:TEMPT-like protein [Mya arenaria]